MAFTRNSKKHNRLVSKLVENSRVHGRDPADAEFYQSRKATSGPVSKFFNAYKISDRQRFTLKAYGKPFNYQGIMTKRYDVAALMTLFFVSRSTIKSWQKLKYLPEPAIKLIGASTKSYWFYHQIQPVYVWYWNLRSRGLKTMHVGKRDCQMLARMSLAMERRWYAKLGIEYIDPYRKIAGKYGVISMSSTVYKP